VLLKHVTAGSSRRTWGCHRGAGAEWRRLRLGGPGRSVQSCGPPVPE
jgi:hypothetical protein